MNQEPDFDYHGFLGGSRVSRGRVAQLLRDHGYTGEHFAAGWAAFVSECGDCARYDLAIVGLWLGY